MAAFDFASDNGPHCEYCKSTIWTYTIGASRITAKCVSCLVLEHFQPAVMPDNAINCRKAHEAARTVETPGFDCICGPDHDCRATGCDENCPSCT